MKSNFRTALALALLTAVPPEPPTMTQAEIDDLEWWKKFVAEIEAIGGIVHMERSTEGELRVDVPRDKQAEAARIVRKYSTRSDRE